MAELNGTAQIISLIFGNPPGDITTPAPFDYPPSFPGPVSPLEPVPLQNTGVTCPPFSLLNPLPSIFCALVQYGIFIGINLIGIVAVAIGLYMVLTDKTPQQGAGELAANAQAAAQTAAKVAAVAAV